ncbi:MAG TPA: hypothetical protein VGF52_05650 [Tepidisphaeraceae bacterium]
MKDPLLTTPALFRAQRPALIVGFIALAICAIFGWLNPNLHEQFFRSYLVGWFFVLGIALGAMSIVMMHHLTGGAWGLLIRRFGEAAAGTLPLLLILFIPIALGLSYLYPWARPGEVASEAVLQHRRNVFNPGFTLLRVLIYFAIWMLFAWRLRRLSLLHERNGDPAILQRLASLSAAGLVVYFITMSLASMDWVASREIHWYSSVFGFIVVIGQALSGTVFMLIMLSRLGDDSPLREAAQPDILQDLGNLLLTLVILWAYMALSQMLVIWMGNEQEEITWYLHRSQGFWLAIIVGLIVLHFFAPFLLLLIQGAKRNIKILGAIASGILVLRYLDVLWLIEPSSPTRIAHGLHWMDFVAPIGIGGIWLWLFLLLLRRRSLIPLGEREEVDLSHGSQTSTT